MWAKTAEFNDMSELITWDYSDAVERVKAKVYRWKKMTADLLKELHTAREELSVPPQKARIMGQMAHDRKTWGDFCADIGLSKRTVNRWLSKFDSKTKSIRQETKKIEAPKQPEEKTYDITATTEIGETLRRRASFRLLLLRLLLHVAAYVWRTLPCSAAVKLRLPPPA